MLLLVYYALHEINLMFKRFIDILNVFVRQQYFICLLYTVQLGFGLSQSLKCVPCVLDHLLDLIVYLLDAHFILNPLHQYKYRFMSNNSILVASKYDGAVLAAKILKDWHLPTRIAQDYQGEALIILEDNQENLYEKHNVHKIVLKDTKMSAQHVLALSGVLVTFGQHKNFFFPKFIVESTISNALAILTLQLLLKKAITTQHVSLVQIVKYFGAFNISAKEVGMIRKPRGENVLEGGAPYYCVYPCKEGVIAVGNLQPKFYSEMVRGLDLTEEEREFCEQSQMLEEAQQRLRGILQKKFKEKSAAEWQKHFLDYDTCVTQIKGPYEYKVREPRLLEVKSKL